MMVEKEYTVVFDKKDGVVPLILSIDKAICKKFWLTPTENTSRKGDNRFELKTDDADIHIDSRKEFIAHAASISGVKSVTFNGAYRRPFLPLGTVHNVWISANPTFKSSIYESVLATKGHEKRKQEPRPDEWDLKLYVGKMGRNLAFIDRAIEVVEELLTPYRPAPETKTPEKSRAPK